MQMQNPLHLPSQTWWGTVELDCGDLGYREFDARVTYTEQLGIYSMDSATIKFWHKIDTPVGSMEISIDVTHLLSEQTLLGVFEDHVVNQ